jgi:hypothetical protein
MARTIDNTKDVVDSRDFMEYLESVREDIESQEGDDSDPAKRGGPDDPVDPDLRAELATLEKVEEEASASADWKYGEALIRDSYFTKYIEELIDDCYPMPKELNSGDWPWRHVTVDYEGAAEEAKSDYAEVDWDGVTYYIRSC